MAKKTQEQKDIEAEVDAILKETDEQLDIKYATLKKILFDIKVQESSLITNRVSRRMSRLAVFFAAVAAIIAILEYFKKPDEYIHKQVEYLQKEVLSIQKILPQQKESLKIDLSDTLNVRISRGK